MNFPGPVMTGPCPNCGVKAGEGFWRWVPNEHGHPDLLCINCNTILSEYEKRKKENKMLYRLMELEGNESLPESADFVAVDPFVWEQLCPGIMPAVAFREIESEEELLEILEVERPR